MKKAASSSAKTKVKELEPFDRRSVDLSKFKSDLSLQDLQQMVSTGIGDHIIFPFAPIETLTCTKTIGLARTNLTFIAPTIVQIDTPSPFASFDVRAQSRHPAIQMHFQPSGYGITSPATYIMEFNIQVFGQSTFNLAGFAGSGTVLNGGTKVLNGQVKVSLVMQNVPPGQQTFGFLEETSGVSWNWFSTQVRFPPIVISL